MQVLGLIPELFHKNKTLWTFKGSFYIISHCQLSALQQTIDGLSTAEAVEKEIYTGFAPSQANKVFKIKKGDAPAGGASPSNHTARMN
jgi:hypothetical protein